MNALLLLAASLFVSSLFPPRSEAGGIGRTIGINYGRVADNLPSPTRAVQLIKNLGIGRVKIFDADARVLSALANSGLKVVVGVPNEEIPELSRSSAAADRWIKRNVLPHFPATQIRIVDVGNEILSHEDTKEVWYQLVPAMKNIYGSLAKRNLSRIIKVTTSVGMDALEISYPPSEGRFRQIIAHPIIKPMLHFLSRTNSYFFLNVYPYFAWEANMEQISLDYVLFGSEKVVVNDGGMEYRDMLSAQLDATTAAMEKLGAPAVRLAISETGWPSKGGANEMGASLLNAATYNRRLVSRFMAKAPAGTPKRPGQFIPLHIFALFDEDQKPGLESERHWGLLYPNGSRKYSIDLAANLIEKPYLDSATTVPLPVLPTPATSQGRNYTMPPYASTIPSSQTFPATPSLIVPSFPARLPSSWCVVNSSVDDTLLEEALEFVCVFGGADCRPIEPGKPCFMPNSLATHASFAFNSYWQKAKHLGGSCTLSGAAMLTDADPSYEGCSFEYRD